MKLIQSSIIRAIIAIAIGILLIKYREETMTWITITAGMLFFISGLISCIMYYFEKEKAAKAIPQVDAHDKSIKVSRPVFPIIGIGSVILGIILAMMPNGFIKWVVYILAAILILGAINQFMNLARSRQFARVPILFWLFPTITLIIGILIIAKPIEVATLPLKVIGWCLMFYGVIEILNAIKITQMKRLYDKIEKSKIVEGEKISTQEIIEDAEIIEEK